MFHTIRLCRLRHHEYPAQFLPMQLPHTSLDGDQDTIIKCLALIFHQFFFLDNVPNFVMGRVV